MATTMASLAKLAQRQLDAEHTVELKELELKKAKAALREIQEETIPDAMEEIGLDKVVTSAGLEVAVVSTVRASMSKANAPKGCAWLREHGHGNLVKTELVVVPSDDKERTALDKKLAKHTVEAKEGVHGGRLSAWVREMMEDGKRIPEKLFGVYRQRTSKITVKK